MSSKGKGLGSWRIRCGQGDRQWKSCPLPYQPTVAFGRSNGLTTNPSRKVMLAEEVSTWNGEPRTTTHNAGDWDIEETADNGPNETEGELAEGSVNDWDYGRGI